MFKKLGARGTKSANVVPIWSGASQTAKKQGTKIGTEPQYMGQQSPDTLLPLWEAMAKAQWVVLRFDTDEDAKQFCQLAGDTFHLIY